MYRTTRLVALLCLSTLLLACAGTSKQDSGTLIGGLIGGLIGHQVDDGGAAGILIGSIAGAALGRMIGQRMDEADRRKLAETLDDTPSGQTRRWHNDETGYDYAVTPTSALHQQGDQQCRSFQQEVIVDGRPEVIDATACRLSEGEPWQVEA